MKLRFPQLVTLLALLLAAWVPAAVAQPAAEAPAQKEERADIARLRKEARGRYKEESVACHRQFTVTRCVDEAQARRRASLVELRRRELTLDEREREAKARQRAERQEQVAREHQESAQHKARAIPLSPRGEPGQAAERAARRAERSEHRRETRIDAQVRSANATAEKSAQASGNARKYEEKLERAEEHARRSREKLEQQKKPPARPLPVPP